MTRDMGCEVLVVGAGPTGLMAALLLRRSGVAVRIVDKRAEASAESRAGVVSARSAELFASLGLAEALFARGVPNTDFDIFVGGRHVGGFRFDQADAPDTPYKFITMIPQAATEAILIEALAAAGVAVERRVEVTGLAERDEGVDVHARGPDGVETSLRAAYIIGADGAHSIVRHALGLSFAGEKYAQTFLLGDVHVDWDLPDERFRVFLNGERLGLYVPFQGEGVARVMATAQDNDATEDASWGPLDLSELETAFTEAAGRTVRLRDPVWLSRFSSQHRVVDRYRVGRAFVAGDAAHIHSPAGGQGMNTGLQDAANLAWKLAAVLRRGAGDALLDTYEAERLPVAHHVLDLSDRMFDMAAAQTGWRARLRDAIAPLVIGSASHLDRVHTLAFRALSQIDVGYREQAAASGNGPSPQRGERAPDAPIRRGRDLLDLLAGYGFTALALSRKRLSLDDASVLAASLGRIGGVAGHIVARLEGPHHPAVERVERSEPFERYGLLTDDAQALLLIRPDGFVAWRAEGLDVPGCAAAFTALLRAAG